MLTRQFSTAIRSIDEKSRQIVFTASTPSVDRYGDSIDPDGFELANFKRNPVFLFQHRSTDPPVGKVNRIWIEPKKALVAQVEFATKSVYPFAETVWQLYRNKFLQAVSVGFLPLESEPLMDGGRRSGEHYLRQELLEISSVAVPANADCLARAVHKGILNDGQARAFEKYAGRVQMFEQFCRDLDREEAEFKKETDEQVQRCLDELFTDRDNEALEKFLAQ